LFTRFGRLHKFVTIKKIRHFDIGTSGAPSPTFCCLRYEFMKLTGDTPHFDRFFP